MQKVIVDYLVKVTTDAEKGKGSWSALATEVGKAGTAVSVVAAGFAATGAAAVAMANDITGTIDRLSTVAVNAGLAAETVAGLDVMARATGKDLKVLIPPDLPKRIKDTADGTGEARRGFEQLGISVTDADGSLKSADKVLRETIDALSRVEDPTLKAAAAQQIFGSGAQELTSALADSGDLDAWIAFAERYGTDVGPEAQRITSEWMRSMALMDAALQSAKNAMLPLIEVMSRTVLGLTAMALAVKGFVSGGGLWGNWADGVRAAYAEVASFANAITELNAELSTTARRVSDVTVELEGWTTTIKGEDVEKFMGFAAIASGKVAAPGTSPVSKPKGSTAGKRERDPLDMTTAELAKLEADAAAFGAELAQGREALVAHGSAAEGAAVLLDRMGQAIAVDTTRSRTGELLGGAEGLSAAVGAIASGVAAAVAPLFIPEQVVSQLEAIRQGIDELPDQLVQIPTLLVGVLDGLAELPMAVVAALPEIAMGVANAVFMTFAWGFEAMLQGFAEVVRQLPGDIAAEIADVLSRLIDNLNPFDGDGNFLFGAAEKALANLPFFDTGGDVTRTGLAVVHEGERVLTAAERAALMGGAGGMGASVYVSNPDPAATARAVARALGPGGQRIRMGV